MKKMRIKIPDDELPPSKYAETAVFILILLIIQPAMDMSITAYGIMVSEPTARWVSMFISIIILAVFNMFISWGK